MPIVGQKVGRKTRKPSAREGWQMVWLPPELVDRIIADDPLHRTKAAAHAREILHSNTPLLVRPRLPRLVSAKPPTNPAKERKEWDIYREPPGRPGAPRSWCIPQVWWDEMLKEEAEEGKEIWLRLMRYDRSTVAAVVRLVKADWDTRNVGRGPFKWYTKGSKYPNK